MGSVTEGGTLGRASDGHEDHRKEGMLGGRSKPPYLRDLNLPTSEPWALFLSPL